MTTTISNHIKASNVDSLETKESHSPTSCNQENNFKALLCEPICDDEHKDPSLFDLLLNDHPESKNTMQEDLALSLSSSENSECCFFDLLLQAHRECQKDDEEKPHDEQLDSISILNPIQTPPSSWNPFAPIASLPISGAPSVYSDPQVMLLFEKMAETLIMTDHLGVSTTSITLDSASFSSSVFYGAKIIIEEFSTAPKIFNVQLVTSSQGAALAVSCAAELVAAFQNGQYNFAVHRLDINLDESSSTASEKNEQDFEDNQEKKHQ